MEMLKMPSVPAQEATLIGLLASHDSPQANGKLISVLNDFCKDADGRRKLSRFHFLVTGGTYKRVIEGDDGWTSDTKIDPVNEETKNFLTERLTVLPSRMKGGVTILSYFITQRVCSILWPFLSPETSHWLTPENLVLLRLCDHWHVKRLMNTGSVTEWFEREAEQDADRNVRPCPPEIVFRKGEESDCVRAEKVRGVSRFLLPRAPLMRKQAEGMTIALIAHDEMKSRMVEFAGDNEHVLCRFEKILTTGTTGREISEATKTLESKIYRYQSGPKGGDIQIAAEILFGRCDVVIFFVDPLRPHPHIEDIRVVFAACMIQDHVRMLTNEMQAREWVERVARRPYPSAKHATG